MPFQSTINQEYGAGVIGELATTAPFTAQVATINSADAANNVVGRYFTLSGENTRATALIAQAGGTGAIGGIFMNPKSQSSLGTSTGTLNPTLAVPNQWVGEFLIMGEVFIQLPASATLDAALKYNTTTGVIGTGAPGGGEAAIPNARVVRFVPNSGTNPQLALVRLSN